MAGTASARPWPAPGLPLACPGLPWPALPPLLLPALPPLLLQVYGGLVEMDFDASHMQLYGHGRYEPMDPSLLPPQPHLQLIYSSAAPSGKDSGSVHSHVRQRWLAGDAAVRWVCCGGCSLALAGCCSITAPRTGLFKKPECPVAAWSSKLAFPLPAGS